MSSKMFDSLYEIDFTQTISRENLQASKPDLYIKLILTELGRIELPIFGS
jgi:hypothetical protein